MLNYSIIFGAMFIKLNDTSELASDVFVFTADDNYVSMLTATLTFNASFSYDGTWNNNSGAGFDSTSLFQFGDLLYSYGIHSFLITNDLFPLELEVIFEYDFTSSEFSESGTYNVVKNFVIDLDDPIIIINSPSQDDTFGDYAPDYDISITEPNLASAWYTIDGGVTNYPISISQLSGTINQEAWKAAPYGSITISFYAEDLVGNIGNDEVIVERVEPTEPVISGYPLLLFIGVVGVITAYSLKKKLK